MNTQNTPILFVNAEDVLNKFEKRLKEFETRLSGNFQPKQPTEYLTRAEVCEMLKIDLSTLWRWTKSGTFNAYGIANRVFYKRSEIEAYLENSKIN